jgi:CO/xanthine dehydrogenase FAD-binding subunit
VAVYLRPTSLDEALAALAGRRLNVLAGGTDHYPARVGRPLDDDILDITGLAPLAGIEQRADHLRIGALATWSAIRDAPLPPWLHALQQAAREVGGRQIQTTATIGGNLCNASPAADGIPPLLALDAEVELAGADGTRRLPLGEFVLGNRRTARRPDQLLTAVLLPKPTAPRSASCFLKLGARRHLVISIVMVAVCLEVSTEGMIARARIAVGACSAVAKRLPAAEAALAGTRLGPDLATRIAPEHLDPLAPIDDVRAGAAYRREAALTLVRRVVAELGAAL